MAAATRGLMDGLRGFIGVPQRGGGKVNEGDQVTGMFKLGNMGSYSGQAWYYGRIVQSVYHNPTGKRCVDAISAAFARAPLTTYRPGDKLRQTPKSSELQALLDNPVPRDLAVQAVSGSMAARKRARDLSLIGFHLVMKIRGDGLTDGPITQLRRLPPQRVTVIGNHHDELLGFVYQDRLGGRLPLIPKWCTYERFAHPDRDYQGFPPALAAGLAAETDNRAARFNLDLLENDGAIPAVVMLEGLTTDQFGEWVAAWHANEDPGRVRFMGFTGHPTGGKSVEVVKVGQTNKELAWDSIRGVSQEDVGRAFGCPPVVYYNLQHETYANAGEEMTHWYANTITDYWQQSADELTVQLGSEYGVDLGYDTHNIPELQESTDSMVSRHMTLQQNRNMSINASNALLGYPKVPWGDVPLPPVLAIAGEPAPAPADPKAPPPDDPTPPADPAPPPPSAPAPPKAALPAFRRRGAAGLAIVPMPSRETAAHTTAGRGAVLQPSEERSIRRLERYFDRQGRVVSKRLTSPGRDRSAASVIRKGLLDMDRWDDELQDDTAELLADVGGEGDRGRAMAHEINEETRAQLERLVTAAMLEGRSINEVAEIVRAYFKERGQDAAAIVKAELRRLSGEAAEEEA